MPAPRPSASTSSYTEYAGKVGVYVVLVGNAAKIGFTANLPRRMRELGATVLVDFASLSSPEVAHAVETVAHARLRDKALKPGGEEYPVAALPKLLAAVRSAVVAVTAP
jgi:hypothetical protein